MKENLKIRGFFFQKFLTEKKYLIENERKNGFIKDACNRFAMRINNK